MSQRWSASPAVLDSKIQERQVRPNELLINYPLFVVFKEC